MKVIIIIILITVVISSLYFYFLKKNKKEAPPININELTDDLKILGELRDKGLVSEEEFNEQKKKLLKQ